MYMVILCRIVYNSKKHKTKQKADNTFLGVVNAIPQILSFLPPG